MNAEIIIQCDDYEELLVHLREIRRRAKLAFSKDGHDTKLPVKFDDNNCYGTHSVKITEPR